MPPIYNSGRETEIAPTTSFDGTTVPKMSVQYSLEICDCVRTKAGRKILLEKKNPFVHRVWKQMERESWVEKVLLDNKNFFYLLSMKLHRD